MLSASAKPDKTRHLRIILEWRIKRKKVTYLNFQVRNREFSENDSQPFAHLNIPKVRVGSGSSVGEVF